jgi:RHS repeat-associated protein
LRVGRGAGSSTQWSPTGCTQNWDCVDDATSDGEATRVESGVPGTLDAYALQDLVQTSKTIASVTVTAVARHYSVACNIEPQTCYAVIALQVNGYSGNSQGLTPVYQSYSQTWTTNPATGQPWTVSEVNALQAGINLLDVGQSARVTQVYVSVATADRTTYQYSNGATGMNQLTSLSTNGGAATTFGYDASGNLLSKFGATKRCYEWNPENLLTKVKTVSSACTEAGAQVQAYTYDGLGRRVKVDGTSSSTWTVSLFSGMDAIYEKDQSGAITKYVYANAMRIAKINPDGTVHYFLSDHQGSTRKILDASRVEQYSVEYEPFGKPYATSGPKPDPHKYTMEKHDDPTGLVYLRARQYDPEVGRFVSADPVLGSLSRPQTQNRYAYVANNPLNYVDPSGEFLIGILAGAIIGGLVGYGLCVWQTGGWTSRECGKAGLIGMAVGAFAGLTFGLGMAAFGVGIQGGIAVGSWAAVGAGVASGAAAGAQTYFFASELAMGTGMMSPQDLSMNDFALSVGLGAAFGGVGGKYYDPKTYWGSPRRSLTVDDVFDNPDSLRAAPGRLKTPTEVSDLIADAQSKGWRVTTLGEGAQKGQGLRLIGTDDGQMIMYHPSGGHHGGYWKVSSGLRGIVKVFPWYTN